MNNKRRLVPFLHILFWLLFLALPLMVKYMFEFSGHSGPPPSEFRPHVRAPRLNPIVFTIITQLVTGITFYVNLFIVFPHLLPKKRYVSLVLSEIALLILSYLGIKSITLLLPDSPPGPGPAIGTIFIFLFVNAIAFSYYIMSENIKADRREKEKESETLKSELQFLRSQISPHFLFNVMNNTVALARVKSDKLEAVLIELSNLMRYMLYEAGDSKVPINKEIDYLKSYIYLQNIRFGQKATINLSVTGQENNTHVIEPMLLIPFVENAFKHGIGLIDEPVIDINIMIDADHLYFISRNKYSTAKNDSKDDVHGIGLTNVKRRLELVYGSNYKLDIAEGEWFSVNLKIKLK